MTTALLLSLCLVYLAGALLFLRTTRGKVETEREATLAIVFAVFWFPVLCWFVGERAWRRLTR